MQFGEKIIVHEKSAYQSNACLTLYWVKIFTLKRVNFVGQLVVFSTQNITYLYHLKF